MLYMLLDREVTHIQVSDMDQWFMFSKDVDPIELLKRMCWHIQPQE